jgi:hypothetical protein
VVVGLYDKKENNPDFEYNHIVPVIGYKKDSTGKTLGIFYNDLAQTSGPKYLSILTTDP